MKISVLVDNRPGNTACATEQGLSLYVEQLQESSQVFTLGCGNTYTL